MKFTPIRSQKISSQIAEQIRKSILNGDFSPGDKLPPERELCQMFGVSRPSVREALHLLSSGGLVKSYQGGGTIVQSLLESDQGNSLTTLIRSEKERALEVVEVRKSMEVWTSYYAAQRALPDDVQLLDDIVIQMKQYVKDKNRLADLDADFHLQIAHATHNIIWLHLMQALFDAMKEFQHGVWRRIYSQGDDVQVLFDHHVRIVEAIRNKQCEEARDAMIEHLSFAEKRCVAYVAQDNKEAGQV